MSEKREFELHVLVGLPGSGKTTFAENEKKNETGSRRVDVIDFDKVARKFKDVYYKDKDQMENVRNMVFSYSTKNIWMLDGLFLTQNDVEWVISVYADSDYLKKYYDISNEDVEKIYKIYNLFNSSNYIFVKFNAKRLNFYNFVIF